MHTVFSLTKVPGLIMVMFTILTLRYMLYCRVYFTHIFFTGSPFQLKQYLTLLLLAVTVLHEYVSICVFQSLIVNPQNMFM